MSGSKMSKPNLDPERCAARCPPRVTIDVIVSDPLVHSHTSMLASSRKLLPMPSIFFGRLQISAPMCFGLAPCPLRGASATPCSRWVPSLWPGPLR